MSLRGVNEGREKRRESRGAGSVVSRAWTTAEAACTATTTTPMARSSHQTAVGSVRLSPGWLLRRRGSKWGHTGVVLAQFGRQAVLYAVSSAFSAELISGPRPIRRLSVGLTGSLSRLLSAALHCCCCPDSDTRSTGSEHASFYKHALTGFYIRHALTLSRVQVSARQAHSS